MMDQHHFVADWYPERLIENRPLKIEDFSLATAEGFTKDFTDHTDEGLGIAPPYHP